MTFELKCALKYAQQNKFIQGIQGCAPDEYRELFEQLYFYCTNLLNHDGLADRL